MTDQAPRMGDGASFEKLEKLLALNHIDEPRHFWGAVVAFLQEIAPHSVAVVSFSLSSIVFHDGICSENCENVAVLRIAQICREIRSDGPICVSSSGIGWDVPIGVYSIGLDEICKTRAYNHPLISEHGCDHVTVLSTSFYHESSNLYDAASFVLYHDYRTAEQAKTNIEQYRVYLDPIIQTFCSRIAKLEVQTSLNAFVMDLPVGMLLVTSPHRPVYANAEAYRQTYLWNVAPKKKVPSDYRAQYKLPHQIENIINNLGIQWRYWHEGRAETFETEDQVVNDMSPELHATVKMVTNRSDPFSMPNFLIRLSMIHPRDQPNEVEIGDLKVSALAELTNSERKVALHVVRGFSNNEIAGMLGRQPCTIKEHLTHIYKKLKVRNRTQLIGRLIERSGPQDVGIHEDFRLLSFTTSRVEHKAGLDVSYNGSGI